MPRSQPRLIEIPSYRDRRGTLSVIDWAQCLPFVPQRFYCVYEVPSGAGRAGHAHRAEEEFIVALSGGFTLRADDGAARTEFRLDRADAGVYLPPLTWHELLDFSPGALCAVLASGRHRDGDYIRDYNRFVEARAADAR